MAASWRRSLAGGFAGRAARAWLGQVLPPGPGRPWAPVVANIAGAFLLGDFATRLQERLPLSACRRPLLGTGFCGGLTTFSTMQVESLRMLDGSHYVLAVAYALVSVVSGFIAVAAATNMARRATSRGRWGGAPG